jgi:hypothetical protein
MFKPLALAFLAALTLAACNGGPSATPQTQTQAETKATLVPPTQAEIEATVKREFNSVYNDKDDIMYKVETCTIDVAQAQVGALYKKQVLTGVEGQDTYPVRVKVNIKVTYSNASPRDIERGVKDDDVFFFYKNAFNEWTFKTGSM